MYKFTMTSTALNAWYLQKTDDYQSGNVVRGNVLNVNLFWAV